MKVFNSIRKYGTLPIATGLVSVAMAVPAFASDAAAASPTDWAIVITALNGKNLALRGLKNISPQP